MTIREYLRDMKRRREARVGKCPECLNEDVVLRKGPGNDIYRCDFCWADTIPVKAAGDHLRDPRTT